MKPFQVKEIASALAARVIGDDNQIINSVNYDTRQLSNGALFVPLIAEHDGHDYIASAIANGAVATLVDEAHENVDAGRLVKLVVKDTLIAYQQLAAWYRRQFDLQVIAITGSNGKTTTKDLVAAIVSQRYQTVKTPANYNNEIGVPQTLLSIEPDTGVLVIELGMDRPGQIDLLSQLALPTMSIINMIGEAHIEFFGTRERIADAKLEITHHLAQDGVFIYNADEPLLVQRAQKVTQKQFTFGESTTSDLRLTQLTKTENGLSFTVNDEENYQLPLFGSYNVINALAAISAGKVLSISQAEIAEALATVDLTQNRAQVLKAANGATLISDVYNSNFTATQQVLRDFSVYPTHGQRIAVLGDMLELGEEGPQMHRDLSIEFDPTEIQSIYLVGDLMQGLGEVLERTYPEKLIHTYHTTQLGLLTQDLQAAIVPNDTVLLKASHGIHLEEVLKALL